MARTGIPYEAVAATADALASEQQTPTIRLIRKRLGDRGSPNTIQRHLQTWRQNRLTEPQAAQTLSKTLLTAIILEVGIAATLSEGEAKQRLGKALTDIGLLAQTGKQLEEEREALLQQLSTAQAEAGRQRQEIAQLKAELEQKPSSPANSP